MNWQLAESTAANLQRASADLVQLYKRISLDHDLEEADRTEFLRGLAAAAGQAAAALRPVVPAAVTVTDIGGNGVTSTTSSASSPPGGGPSGNQPVSPRHRR